MIKYMKRNMNWQTGTVFFLVLAVLLVMFIKQYMVLGDTIEEERATYVSEIKDQLVRNINAEKKQQTDLVNIYAKIITDLKLHKFKEIKSILSDQVGISSGDEIFLMDIQGNIYTLDKEQKSVSEQSIVYELTVEKKEAFGYMQVNHKEEFWIYGAPVETIVIDQIEICAVINARSIENFGKKMATSILDNNGFSYIMSKSGNVLLFPTMKNGMGYNLFDTLQQYGVEEAKIAKMQQDFMEGTDEKEIFFFNGNRWLLDYSGDLFDDWVVVVMMPMTITGADTYKMLNTMLILSVLLFGSIVLPVVFIIRNSYMRERIRERAIQQEKAELVIAQRTTETKNEFLAKMSHDIRTPLNAIIGLIQITTDLVSDRPEAADNLEQAGKSAEYLQNILNDILDMSKIESGKMEVREAPFDLQELVESLKMMNQAQADKKKIKFVTQMEGKSAEYYLGDKVRISQIMMNLLSNAIKFTNPGGHIYFYVNTEPESYRSDTITFQVKDDGVGMSAEYQKHLFQPFEQEEETQTMNYCGSGLGMSIVKNLVVLMGGTIEVESEKGVGSCFTVVLCLRRTEKPEEIVKTGNDISLKGKRVLLTEDNEINVMIAKKMLETGGEMVVDTAENGLEAVERFKESAEGDYDVILMDIRMPVMDGLEATVKIRELSHPQAKTIPIIAMSANAFDDDIEKALKCGMNAYLSKPVDRQKIINTLKELI